VANPAAGKGVICSRKDEPVNLAIRQKPKADEVAEKDLIAR
jgi:hypothetical protein